jgi:mannose/fructose-specific phosphotransferase system component IIA
MFLEGDAGIAQLVEQLICNQQVIGSSPIAGSPYNQALRLIMRSKTKFVFATCLPLLR